jgi:hypothetical protein
MQHIWPPLHLPYSIYNLLAFNIFFLSLIFTGFIAYLKNISTDHFFHFCIVIRYLASYPPPPPYLIYTLLAIDIFLISLFLTGFIVYMKNVSTDHFFHFLLLSASSTWVTSFRCGWCRRERGWTCCTWRCVSTSSPSCKWNIKWMKNHLKSKVFRLYTYLTLHFNKLTEVTMKHQMSEKLF